MLPAFITYCRSSWLPANLPRPFYRAQAETYVETLARRIDGLNKDIDLNTQEYCWINAMPLLAEREWLMNELAIFRKLMRRTNGQHPRWSLP